MQDSLFQTHRLSNGRVYGLRDIRDFPLKARNINVFSRKILLTSLNDLADYVGNIVVGTSIVIATKTRQPDIDSLRYRLVRINNIGEEQWQVQASRVGGG